MEDIILDRVRHGMLFPLLPRTPGDCVERPLFVGEALWSVLNSPAGDRDWERRIAELRADLERFVTGEALHPRYLFLLSPARDSVWEIRSTGSNPSIRVLGFFAMKDVYIATNFALREDLGGWESREWKSVKRMAGAAWNALFHPYKPLGSSRIHDLVTGALDGQYFK